MSSRRVTTILTYSVLIFACMVSFSLPQFLPSISSAATQKGGKPAVILVAGIVRDFSADHPDFDVTPGNGYGHVMGNIRRFLDKDGKPVFRGGGFRVSKEWRDKDSNKICYSLFDLSRGDSAGSTGKMDRGAITSTETFSQWFRDVPGVNISKTYAFNAHLNKDGTYVYETNDFFPIDGALNGNGPDNHNYYFTFEVAGTFVHDESADHMFEFKGDDDVWVFIDGKLVADLGGIAGNEEQFVELNRLGLVDGKTYTLKFFMGERHQPQSNFRFSTTVELATYVLPTVTASYD
ncbi:MAG: fibro-slime domain-containing protein [Planctomycetes bacterium]|nr:fibro-slime domain-containing protein [Planctomycetota bacterium]